MKRRRIAPVGGWKTGVYCIRNTVNGKVYVGSAARDFEHRFGQHKGALRYGNHHTSHLQSAWNKYGEVAFEFVVLERCQPDLCLDREQYWIDRLHATDSQFGYNSVPATGRQIGSVNSPETREKIRTFWRNAKENPIQVSIRFAERFHLKSSEPVYIAWNATIKRRRSLFCIRWLKFENFYADMGPRPVDRPIIGRIDADGLYELSNCRWMTRMESAHTSLRSKLIAYNGKTQHIAAWARELSKNRIQLATRLREGWSFERAISEPYHKMDKMTFNGETHSVAEWARLKGLSHGCICGRQRMGWSIDRILTTPTRGKYHPRRRRIQSI